MSLVLLSPPSPTLNASQVEIATGLVQRPYPVGKSPERERDVARVPASSGSLKSSNSRMDLALAITGSPLPCPGLPSALQGLAGKCRSPFPQPLNLNDMGASSSTVCSPHAPSPTQEMFYVHSSNLAWHEITSHSLTLKFNTIILPNNTFFFIWIIYISVFLFWDLPLSPHPLATRASVLFFIHVKLVPTSKALHVLSLSMLFLHLFTWLAPS